MEQVSFDEFATIFANTTKVEDVKKIMQDIFTPAEIEDFTKRITIFKALKEGNTQRQIAKEFRLSLCKITRGAKILKSNDSLIAKLI